MYKLIRKLLFLFDPEKVHHFTFSWIKFTFKLPFVRSVVKSNFKVEDPKLERKLFGLTFKNPVGLAAGMDKNALLFDEFSYYGFGFIEIGTVTPKPQDGNPKKRLFRLKEDGGIINRMGFNNEGVDAAVKRLQHKKTDIIIGGNIGKNKATPNENAIDDYIICFNKLFDVVDYFVVNVSSPNTPNLRDLQEKEPLTKLLNTLQSENFKKEKRKPILLKIAPDLTDSQLLDIIDIVKTTKIDGVIATNTTISREGLQSENKEEVGGLSGKPLTNRSTEVIRFLAEKSKKAFPIIGVGGIHSAKGALEKIEAGADLVQIYTGFIYEGPKLVKRINQELVKA
ncbi:quinone-dependent dihydroorotate dehydrogenase [Aureibaculum conchae]|uniref:quinone-dependent dihydroorotate dehydrogenase n=1 Tax=Aureibaculum sp. 2308TA14-22 TaxID=3108392 RepID=UPI0033928075